MLRFIFTKFAAIGEIGLMNTKAKILSSLFLIVYLTFLFHDVFSHNHHHESHEQHACILSESDQKSETTILFSSDCNHLYDDCFFCNEGQSLHDQIKIAKDHKIKSDSFLPSKKIRLEIKPAKISTAYQDSIDLFNTHYHLTLSSRAPPQIS